MNKHRSDFLLGWEPERFNLGGKSLRKAPGWLWGCGRGEARPAGGMWGCAFCSVSAVWNDLKPFLCG